MKNLIFIFVLFTIFLFRHSQEFLPNTCIFVQTFFTKPFHMQNKYYTFFCFTYGFQAPLLKFFLAKKKTYPI
jgi:hypothetical protein